MLAQLWETRADASVHCQLCQHSCVIKDGAHGICGVRANYRGELISLVGNVVTALNMDPVEKKPLYHFLPGTRTFSIGSAGCNFHCRFCQNDEIAHVNPRSTLSGRRLTPETLVRLAGENRAPSMAFTYNEPTVFFEQVYHCAGLARAHGIKTILVSNGFMSPECLQSLSKRVDAANIDLKGFSEDFYRKYCGGRLKPVLDNLKIIKNMGWHLEVTTLVIPGVNDSAEELGGIARFIHDELGPNTPWHVSGFHGAAEMLHHPSTPLATLEKAWQTGRDAGLSFVYIGNAQTSHGTSTLCPSCGKVLIERRGYRTRKLFKDDKCPHCQTEIPGVWS